MASAGCLSTSSRACGSVLTTLFLWAICSCWDYPLVVAVHSSFFSMSGLLPPPRYFIVDWESQICLWPKTFPVCCSLTERDAYRSLLGWIGVNVSVYKERLSWGFHTI